MYERSNIDHGKFAFVVPYADFAGDVHALHSEMHRKIMKGKLADSIRDHPAHPHAARKLLELEHHDMDLPHGAHEIEDLEHLLADARKEQYHHKDGHGVHHAHSHHGHHHHKSHGHDGAHDKGHDKGDGHDVDFDDDYDYEDDEFDMDNYDGIHDEELKAEMERNERDHNLKMRGGADPVERELQEELTDSRRFEVCLYNTDEKSDRLRRVRLIIHKGHAAHDYTSLAKKEHMNQLEISLHRVSEELHDLLRELDKARMMENILQKINEDTNRRVIYLAVLSLLTLFGVAGYQARYTKRFFKRKKIL